MPDPDEAEGRQARGREQRVRHQVRGGLGQRPAAPGGRAWPRAQARLPRPNASPWSSRWCWAPSLTSAMAGVNSVPKEGMPTISAAMSTPADASVGPAG